MCFLQLCPPPVNRKLPPLFVSLSLSRAEDKHTRSSLPKSFVVTATFPFYLPKIRKRKTKIQLQIAGGKNVYKLSIKCITSRITVNAYSTWQFPCKLYTLTWTIYCPTEQGGCRQAEAGIGRQRHVGDDGHTLGDNVANCHIGSIDRDRP